MTPKLSPLAGLGGMRTDKAGMPPALFCDFSYLGRGLLAAVSLKWNAMVTRVVIRRLVDLLKGTQPSSLGGSAVQSPSILK